jgi:hypothetical protein
MCSNLIPGHLRMRKFLGASAKVSFNKAKCFHSDAESPQLKMQMGQSGFLKRDAKFCRQRQVSILCACDAGDFRARRSNLINKQFGKKAGAPCDNFLNSSQCECGLVEQTKGRRCAPPRVMGLLRKPCKLFLVHRAAATAKL